MTTLSITSDVLRDILRRPELIHRDEYKELREFVRDFRIPPPPPMPSVDGAVDDEEDECPPPLSPPSETPCVLPLFDMDDCALLTLVQDSKDKGKKLFDDGNYSEALVEFSTVVSIRPSAISHCWRARCFSKLGKLDEALSDVDCAIERTPDYHAAYHLRGRILFDMGDYKRAAESLGVGQQYEADPESSAMIKLCKEKLVADKEAADKASSKTASFSGVDVPSDDGPSSSSCTPPGGPLPDDLSSALSGMNLDQLMKNPQMQKMAEQMMSNPEIMNNLMGSFQNAKGR